RLAQRMPRYAPAAADTRHMLAVPAHRFAALAACLACFLWREPVCRAKGLCGESAAPGDLPLFFLVHRGEATRACSARKGDWLNGHKIPLLGWGLACDAWTQSASRRTASSYRFAQRN